MTHLTVVPSIDVPAEPLSFAQTAEQTVRTLFPHASQRRVMWALFQRPWTWQHLTGLARAAGIPGSSTTRALHELVEKGFVQEDHLANLRIFHPRMEFAHCEKMRRQFVNAYGAPAYLHPALQQPGVVAALVFGSIAKGSDHAKSDVDVMVVTALPQTIVHHASGLGTDVGVPIDEPGTQREVRMVQVCLDDLDRRIAADPTCFWAGVLSGPVLPVHGDVTALVQRYFPSRYDVTALPLTEASWTAGNDVRHRMRDPAGL